jgi:hypothetical protein
MRARSIRALGFYFLMGRMNKSSWSIIMKALLTLLIVCLLGGLFCFTGLAAINGEASDEPTVVSAVAPTYPMFVRGGAGAFDLSGEIYVGVSIDETGNVSSVRALNGAPLLQQVAEKAAKRWKFASAVEGTGIRTVRLHFIFRTMPRGASDDELSPIFTPPYSVEVRRISVSAKPNNSFNRSANSIDFIRENPLIIMARRARLIRALGV